MLVDPTTGQHYILPAQVHQPQLYYPVFYNPSQPPPPLYNQGAYLVTSMPTSVPIAQARPLLLHSNANYHTAPIQSAPVSTFASYHQTETPALSTAAPSVYGDHQNEMHNYFQRAQNTRNSMESAGSSSASFPQNKHSDGRLNSTQTLNGELLCSSRTFFD